jgi:hypothetical protein
MDRFSKVTSFLKSSSPVFSGVRVTRSLVLYVCFVDHCLSFSTFSFDHHVLSVFFFLYTDSDNSFDFTPPSWIRPCFVSSIIITLLINNLGWLLLSPSVIRRIWRYQKSYQNPYIKKNKQTTNSLHVENKCVTKRLSNDQPKL